ncbi:MAG: signal peptidase I [Bacilli bacterium]|nr:signal peptidase I [Bacilli bacterium]MDD4644036.1 signal peptidase I [Bacilli bacterium]
MDEIIEFIKDMFKYIIIVGIIILIRIYVLTTTEVVGNSMEPNLNDGNILLVEQITQRFSDYNRFDVIVFERSPSYLIKRIIGLPGETIKYEDNKLYINDKLVIGDFEVKGNTDDFGPVTIPDNSYFVLGDNREDSKDSRTFGAIKRNKIIGKPFFNIWPFNELKIVK